MNKLLALPFLFISFFGFGQDVDSLRVAAEVDSLLRVSSQIAGQGKIDEALEIMENAREITLKNFGENSKINACVDINYAIMNFYQGTYSEAEKHLLVSESIFKANQLTSDYHYSRCLNFLSIIYQELNSSQKAEDYILKTLKLREEIFGTAHPQYLGVLVNLGVLYINTGEYEKAEPILFKAKKIFETEIKNPKHDFYINCVLGIGSLKRYMGEYEKAEPIFLDLIHSYEVEWKQTEHPTYANLLNKCNLLYQDIGLFEKAESFGLKAQKITEKLYGKGHPYYAGNLINLSDFYIATNQYEKAESLLLEGKEIFAVELKNESHVFYSSCLLKLAFVYSVTERISEAETLFLEATALKKKELGENHDEYFWALTRLAGFYKTSGELEKAKEIYLQASTGLEKKLGKTHLRYIESIQNLAEVYFRLNDFESGVALTKETSVLNQNRILKSMHHLSEKEMTGVLKKFTTANEQALSFATNKNLNSELSGINYNNVLFHKGFLLNAANQSKKILTENKATQEKYSLLKSYTRHLAGEYSKPFAERDSVSVLVLEEKSNALEKDIALEMAGYREKMKQVKWRDVGAKLKPSEIAMEFTDYQFFEKEDSKDRQYSVLLLRKNSDSPKLIYLFNQSSLDSLLKLNQARRSDYVNDLYAQLDRGAVAAKKSRKTLFDLIWQPLEKELEGIETVYYSPSGLLHRINLGAIPIDEETALADKYNLIQVNSTRQLVIPSEVENSANDALLFGGIQYEIDSTAIVSTNSTLSESLAARSRGGLSFENADSTLRGGAWNYLKWTKKEVESISEVLETANFKTTARTDYEATEEAFKSIGETAASPRVLHIATHGFFFPDPASTGSASEMTDEPVFKMSEHPMIRSGLIMAGGNHVWQNKPALEGMEDGILTAYEISQMNLSNTELVVLSACETGLGDIEGNEGVYGLQRAFKIAGAKYLIMSLWQVPDRETKVFMETFYKNWLEGEMTIPDAFRKTQREMKERFFNPYQWAGFVLVE